MSISNKTVVAIRRTAKKGTLTQLQIAKRFRTTQASVSRILNGLQRASVVG